ncbi:unnamed protein product [Gordionus sp. m RMFG-2023]|uniref:ras-related protein Rab-8B-like n=1 Tax=Gordionus sp. m RMFG-2023 TaxID=3053472 RepID=UPI0030E09BF0
MSLSNTSVKVPYDYLFKILLIGDSGVGKTCLLFRFSDDAFNTTFIATIGIDFKIKTIEIDGKKIKLQIWDTAGHERFRTITTAYYRGAMGILLVYDITNEKSFDNIKNWIRNIEEHTTTHNSNFNKDISSPSSNVEKIICGNKCDVPAQLRQVSKERGQELASEQSISFLETSAKSGINVEKAFHILANNIKIKTEQKLKLTKSLQTPSSNSSIKSLKDSKFNASSNSNSFLSNILKSCTIL